MLSLQTRVSRRVFNSKFDIDRWLLPRFWWLRRAFACDLPDALVALGGLVDGSGRIVVCLLLVTVMQSTGANAWASTRDPVNSAQSATHSTNPLARRPGDMSAREPDVARKANACQPRSRSRARRKSVAGQFDSGDTGRSAPATRCRKSRSKRSAPIRRSPAGRRRHLQAETPRTRGAGRVTPVLIDLP